MSTVLVEKLTVPHLVKNISIFCGNERLIKVFTKVNHENCALLGHYAANSFIYYIIIIIIFPLLAA
jgi:hypothetical protein